MGRRGEREAGVQTGGVQGLAWVLGIRKLKQQPKLPPPPPSPSPWEKHFLSPFPLWRNYWRWFPLSDTRMRLPSQQRAGHGGRRQLEAADSPQQEETRQSLGGADPGQPDSSAGLPRIGGSGVLNASLPSPPPSQRGAAVPIGPRLLHVSQVATEEETVWWSWSRLFPQLHCCRPGPAACWVLAS